MTPRLRRPCPAARWRTVAVSAVAGWPLGSPYSLTVSATGPSRRPQRGRPAGGASPQAGLARGDDRAGVVVAGGGPRGRPAIRWSPVATIRSLAVADPGSAPVRGHGRPAGRRPTGRRWPGSRPAGWWSSAPPAVGGLRPLRRGGVGPGGGRGGRRRRPGRPASSRARVPARRLSRRASGVGQVGASPDRGRSVRGRRSAAGPPASGRPCEAAVRSQEAARRQGPVSARRAAAGEAATGPAWPATGPGPGARAGLGLPTRCRDARQPGPGRRPAGVRTARRWRWRRSRPARPAAPVSVGGALPDPTTGRAARGRHRPGRGPRRRPADRRRRRTRSDRAGWPRRSAARS